MPYQVSRLSTCQPKWVLRPRMSLLSTNVGPIAHVGWEDSPNIRSARLETEPGMDRRRPRRFFPECSFRNVSHIRQRDTIPPEMSQPVGSKKATSTAVSAHPSQCSCRNTGSVPPLLFPDGNGGARSRDLTPTMWIRASQPRSRPSSCQPSACARSYASDSVPAGTVATFCTQFTNMHSISSLHWKC